jgi:hypothetical protein
MNIAIHMGKGAPNSKCAAAHGPKVRASKGAGKALARAWRKAMDTHRVKLGVALLLCVTSPLFAATEGGGSPAKPAAPVDTGEIRLVPRVDERVELLSIVFRLAGNFEYNMSQLALYTTDIDRYFAPYKNHPAVTTAAKIAKDREVGFDAVMAMAIYLSPPPDLAPIVPFSDQVPEGRWGKENATAFVSLLRDFYRDTNFHAFFAARHELYDLAESRFALLLGQLDLAWYKQFYGTMPNARFNLILGMNNGGGNYGPKVVFPDGREELFAIIGVWTKDDAGRPTFDSHSGYLSTIIHEFNHSFINAVVHENAKEFGSAERVFKPVAGQMQQMAYDNPETMVDESLVRAAVILYFESHGSEPSQTRNRIRAEQAAGFIWMDELCDLLRKYESDRQRYPTFKSFLPAVVEFYNSLAPRIGSKIAEFHERSVHVLRVEPFPNHAVDVDPEIKQLTIVFDQPLDPARGYSINYGSEGKEHFAISGHPQFVPGNKAITLPVELKPGWSYSFVLTGLAFASPDGYPLESYEVSFKTKKAK